MLRARGNQRPTFTRMGRSTGSLQAMRNVTDPSRAMSSWDHEDEVEAWLELREVGSRGNEQRGGLLDPLDLSWRDRRERSEAGAGFYLADRKHPPAPGNEVDLAAAGAVAALEYPPAVDAESPRGDPLAPRAAVLLWSCAQ